MWIQMEKLSVKQQEKCRFTVGRNVKNNAKKFIVIFTIGSKIILTLEVIRVSIPNAVLWNKYLSSHHL